MKKILSFFASINKNLNIGVLVSLVCVILVDFVFSETEEVFTGGAKLGVVLSNLSLAYIASYIFYAVVVHYKYLVDKQHLDPYIELKSAQIINAVRVPIHHLILNTGKNTNSRYLDEEELNDIASQTHSADPAPEAYIGPTIVTMSDFFYHWKKLCQERLESILALSLYLDPEHIKLLLALQESSFFFMLDSNARTKLNCSFGVVTSSLFQLSESAKELENYCKTNFKNSELFNDNN